MCTVYSTLTAAGAAMLCVGWWAATGGDLCIYTADRLYGTKTDIAVSI